jgi:hypothetical protein
MAIHAPRHREWRDLFDLRHLIYTAMACLAADTLTDVNRVIEVDEVSELRYASPRNRKSARDTLPHGRHRCARQPERRVTADALLSRWQSSRRAAVDARVAVATIDTQGTRVQSMIEGQRLHDRFPLTARPRRTDPEHGERWYSDRNRDQPHQRTSSDSSRAWREECRHQLSECEVSRGAERHSKDASTPHTSRRNRPRGRIIAAQS